MAEDKASVPMLTEAEELMLGVQYLSPWTPKASVLTWWAWHSHLGVEQGIQEVGREWIAWAMGTEGRKAAPCTVSSCADGSGLPRS